MKHDITVGFQIQAGVDVVLRSRIDLKRNKRKQTGWLGTRLNKTGIVPQTFQLLVHTPKERKTMKAVCALLCLVIVAVAADWEAGSFGEKMKRNKIKKKRKQIGKENRG